MEKSRNTASAPVSSLLLGGPANIATCVLLVRLLKCCVVDNAKYTLISIQKWLKCRSNGGGQCTEQVSEMFTMLY